MFGDLAKMLASQGALNWDAARQFALSIATDGHPESNVDPVLRIELEPLVRIADLHVADITGLDTTVEGQAATLLPVSPGVWSLSTLDAFRPIFEHLATALKQSPAVSADNDDLDDSSHALMAGLQQMMAPMLLGMAAGSMVGHLAARSFGQYDLPLPRPRSHEIHVQLDRVDGFANDWSLRRDDVRMWVSLYELTMHTVLGIEHVRTALTDLLTAHAAAFRPQPDALARALEDVDPSAMGSEPAAALQQVFGRPDLLLGAMATPQQEALAVRLDALVALIVGYVDHVLDVAGTRVIGNGAVAEAVRRRRIEHSSAGQFTDHLLGLRLGRAQVERGHAFVRGVMERAGDDGFKRLFTAESELPTPAELDAPGLWLARIELD
jgi:putative hydrolase